MIKYIVLLVEDDPINQITIKRCIGKKYKTLIADSSEEAMRVLKDNEVDLILMDMSINGDKNGLELTKGLKIDSKYCHIPIIADTAHVFESNERNAFEAACDAYLAKPFPLNELLERIESLIPVKESILS